MFEKRRQKLLRLMKEHQLDAVALMPGPNLFYLTGLRFHLSERPVVAFFTDQETVLVLPELERDRAAASGLDVRCMAYSEDQATLSQAFKEAAAFLSRRCRRVAAEALRMRLYELRILETVAPDITLLSGEDVLSSLRVAKDQNELRDMRRAVEIAQIALSATLRLAKIGMSERQLASELVLQLLRAGSDPELPFNPIVASGPNSALPHAVPTDRSLQPGDLLLLDWGAAAQGYLSDLTRTFAIAEVNPELGHIYDIVLEANAAGRSAVRPGVECGQVDRSARQVIEAAGYGGRFVHRTGHGLGLEVHEPPYIRPGNRHKLLPGMTFTIEPGIYLQGLGGVRIEDQVLVTAQGGESLSDYGRELEVIG